MINRFRQLSPEKRHLLIIECFVVGLFLALVLSSGRAGAWPLIHWPLYSGGEPRPLADRPATVILRVTDVRGGEHVVRSYDLYTLDDDASQQVPGQVLLLRSFASDVPSDELIPIRTQLVTRVEAVLHTQVAEIEGWRYEWEANVTRYPVIDPDHPVARMLIDTIHAADYRQPLLPD